jgi:uncharacterized protein GlcG (DUF336 family)
MKKLTILSFALSSAVLAFANQNAVASCADIITAFSNAGGSAAVTAVVGTPDNGGYGLPMWVTAVDETGKVCGVLNTSGQAGNANIGNYSWLGSRVISAQKANTANAFSLNAFSISSGNLDGLTLPGGSLNNLPFSNPVDATTAYLGDAATFATSSDPLNNKRIGGINTFGGGLALYNSSKIKVGAIGVSGDTSCTDHAVAWKIRALLNLNHVPGGFVSGWSGTPGFTVLGDELIIDTSGNSVANTYYQVSCAHNKISNPNTGAATGVIITNTP